MTRLFSALTLFISWLALGSSVRDAIDLARIGLTPVLGGTDTDFATGAAETVKRWAARVWIEATRTIYWQQVLKENDENAVISVMTELEKGPGDKITFSLNRKLTGTGIADDNMLEGNEEQLSVYSDSVTLAQRRHAVRLNGRMSERRTAFKQRDLAKRQLKSWLAEYLDDNIFTGMDSSPTTVIYGGAATSTATLTAADKFTPQLISKAIAKAKKASPKIWPIDVGGKKYYVVIVHTDVGFDLKRDAEWQQAQREANTRGMDNPIFSGALGTIDGAVVHEHEKAPISTTYGAGGNIAGASAGFFGQQAGMLAYGMRPQAWEKEFDYNAKVGFAIGVILKNPTGCGFDNRSQSLPSHAHRLTDAFQPAEKTKAGAGNRAGCSRFHPRLPIGYGLPGYGLHRTAAHPMTVKFFRQ
jgi:N4-gp56 family major capsid protein